MNKADRKLLNQYRKILSNELKEARVAKDNDERILKLLREFNMKFPYNPLENNN
jgi:hypothetical protein